MSGLLSARQVLALWVEAALAAVPDRRVHAKPKQSQLLRGELEQLAQALRAPQEKT
jgi:hypothetical protein